MKRKKEHNLVTNSNSNETTPNRNSVDENERPLHRNSGADRRGDARGRYANVSTELRGLLEFMERKTIGKLSMPDKLAAVVHYIAFLEAAILKTTQSDNHRERLMLTHLFDFEPGNNVVEEVDQIYVIPSTKLEQQAKCGLTNKSHAIVSADCDNPTPNSDISINELGNNIHVDVFIEQKDQWLVRRGPPEKRCNVTRTAFNEFTSLSFMAVHTEVWATLKTRAIPIVKNLETLQMFNASSNSPERRKRDSKKESTTPTHVVYKYTDKTMDTDAKMLLSLSCPVHFSPSRFQSIFDTEPRSPQSSPSSAVSHNSIITDNKDVVKFTSNKVRSEKKGKRQLFQE